MPRVFAHVEAPPPFLVIVGGTTAVTLPHDGGGGGKEPPPSSASSSVMIVIIVISSAIIVSASVYLLLRFFSRRFRSFSAVDDVVTSSSRNIYDDSRRVRCSYERKPSDDLISSLPLFTFGSVTGNLTGADCAVCLSKFEKTDQLRLLPLCCHAFHSQCIDTWLSSNLTCPLCRSTIHPTEADVLNKILPSSTTEDRGSFRIQIGNVSRRRAGSESGDGRRSYSIGDSFDYVVDEDGYELSVASTQHRRGLSDCTSIDKDSTGVPDQPGGNLAAEVAGRSWLRDYVERIASISSRTLSFRSSGRFFTGSSRRSDAVVGIDDLEASRIGDEISELFRWFSGV